MSLRPRAHLAASEGPDEILAALHARLTAAGDSSPESGVVSIDSAELASVVEALRAHYTELVVRREELLEVHEQLAASRDRHFQLFELSAVAYLTVSKEGLIAEANGAAATLFELTKSQFIGTPLAKHLTPDSAYRVVDLAQMIADQEELGDTEVGIRTASGKKKHVHLRGAPLVGHTSGLALVALIDVTVQKRTEEALARSNEHLLAVNQQLEAIAARDPLTGLFNRRGLEVTLRTELERMRHGGAALAAIFLDCDDFKRVNDTLGHAAGDLVLGEVSKRLLSAVRPMDCVARVGGDEFIVLLPDAKLGQAAHVAERVRLAVGSEPVAVSHMPVTVTTSLAVVDVPASVVGLEEILGAARGALSDSKRLGKNRTSVATRQGSSIPPPSGDEGMSELRLRLARPNFFRVVAHPVLSTRERRTVAFELLVRGRDPRWESPAAVFQQANQDGLLALADGIALRACLREAAQLPSNLTCHVNLYPSTLLDATPGTIEALIEPLVQTRPVCVELSEQQLLGDPSYLRPAVERLRATGAMIAIDDVGFGRTALENLVVVGPDTVKIDRSYVTGVSHDERRRHALRRLLAVARALDAQIVAEGVETESDLAVLVEEGVECAQGFLWGEPAPIESFAT